MKITRRPILIAPILVAALAVSCGSRQPIVGEKASDLDRKLSTFAFIEDGDLVTFIVDTRAARFRDESAYMPVEICIANRRLRTLSLTRESFTLIDEEGNRYPAAGPQELIERYKYLDIDRSGFAELEGIVFNKFAAFHRYPSKFSPTREGNFGKVLAGGSELVRDRINLPKFGYLLDFIYFPRPSDGLMGPQVRIVPRRARARGAGVRQVHRVVATVRCGCCCWTTTIRSPGTWPSISNESDVEVEVRLNDQLDCEQVEVGRLRRGCDLAGSRPSGGCGNLSGLRCPGSRGPHSAARRVCLGMQAIAQAEGADDRPRADVDARQDLADQARRTAGCSPDSKVVFEATRYHSLVIDPDTASRRVRGQCAHGPTTAC